MAEKIKLVRRLDTIKELCSGKSVLHLGCTNYPYTELAINSNTLLHFELEKLAGELYGFDFGQEGLDILGKHGSLNLFRADLEHLGVDVVAPGDHDRVVVRMPERERDAGQLVPVVLVDIV